MASRFWVGGTGTWDSTTTTHWSATTGGAGGATAPVTGDSVTFDGSSGGGVVTADTTINNLSLANITFGAFTGTLDFSVNNPNLTISTLFSITGTATRTLSLGSGTFHLTGTSGTIFDGANTTGLTLNQGTSTFSIDGTLTAGVTFSGPAAKSINNLSIAAQTNSNYINLAGAFTVAGVLSIAAGANVRFQQGQTVTLSSAFTWVGTSSNPIEISTDSSGQAAATISAVTGSTAQWTTFRGMTFSGTAAALTATNSLNLRSNTLNGGSITPPSVGGGGSSIIGG